MTRLRSLIKEVLSQPKKKDCGCGCNDCGGKAPILTEGRIKKAISEGLTYHVENKIPLHESVYRIGSEKHFALINEARKLWTRGLIDVSKDDQAILETHLGNFGMYEGEEVPLDMPMVHEAANSGASVQWPDELDSYYGMVTFKKVDEFQNGSIAKYDIILNKTGEVLESREFQFLSNLEYMASDYALPKGGTQSSGFGESLEEVTRYSGFNRNPEDPDSVPFEPKGSVAQFKEDLRALFGKFKGDLRNPEFIGGVAEIMVSWKSLLRSQLNEKVLSENQLDKIEDWMFQNGWGFIKDYRREDESGPNKKIAFLAYDSEEQKDLSKGQSLNVGRLDELIPTLLNDINKSQQLVNLLKLDYLPSATKITKKKIKQAGVDMVIVVNKNVDNNIINEAKKKAKSKKKDPPLNKPERGGSKAYFVYVRDPKTKKIKKVSFGSGGLRAKIKNKQARNAFAARHNCKNKKDRTKAGYWSCNLPRYAEQLGLGSKMNTFW
jgi:hypothetical protein